jgi:hypothetical protein
MLRASQANQTRLDLYSLFGSVKSAQTSVIVRFASTFASSRQENWHRTLVRELKAVREIIPAGSLPDLRSLLQRDLNDSRVARDLIPYLRGEGGSGIGFFPAILAVLVPRGYLTNPEVAYPRPRTDEADPNVVHYDDCWTVERYSLGDGPDAPTLPLGLLKVVPGKAEIIVLDGQHRANAFRFMAGNQPGNIYQTFYQNVRAVTADEFQADLPVTLIWFESDADAAIRPELISRRLFVDVNNTVKRVSVARTILLDDRAATCVATTEFYNYAAQSGFRPDALSLLHTGFDLDSDSAQNRSHRFLLTTPEVVNYALYWAFFCSPLYENRSVYKVSRDSATNRDRFGNLFPGFENLLSDGDEDDVTDRYRRLQFKDADDADNFRATFREAYLPVLQQLFEQFHFLKPHYEAAKETEEWVNSGGTSGQREVWKAVFCGGEGLYWSIQGAESEQGKNYQTAVREVEDHFGKARARRLGTETPRADRVYGSFCTKAFQSGFVGAVAAIEREEGGGVIVCAERLVAALNQYTYAHWCAIFTSLRDRLSQESGGLNPVAWPMYRNLLLRLYDNQGQQVFYSEYNRKDAPEWRVYRRAMERAANDYIAVYTEAEQAPDEAQLRQKAADVLKDVETLLADCGIKRAPWFDPGDIVPLGYEILRKRMDDHYGKGTP